mmetsp:Transcript_7523/g.13814  ORF Transcript_7523/g.13814 Transcript_7523/m.13814 type:complete len:147 (+) Transcript_7523:753-1193(+)
MKKLAAFLVLTVFRRPTVCQSKKCTMKLVLKRLTISDLMTRDEYMGVWRTIASGGTSGEGRNQKQFWQKFQDRMNEAFNEVNVLMAGSLIVSLDDDKKKTSIGQGKDMQGLKQHVLSDRRKGKYRFGGSLYVPVLACSPENLVKTV